MPKIISLNTTAASVQPNDTIMAASILVEDISKGKRINLNNFVVTQKAATASGETIRFSGHNGLCTDEEEHMYVRLSASVIVFREVATDEEVRADRAERVALTVAHKAKKAKEAIEAAMSRLLDDDGNVCPFRFVEAVRQGRVDDIIEHQVVLAAAEYVQQVVEAQEAGDTHGDILDAVEMAEANAEMEGRRMLARTTSSKSTNGYSNSVDEAEGVANAKLSTGLISTGYAEMYGPNDRMRAAAARLRGERI